MTSTAVPSRDGRSRTQRRLVVLSNACGTVAIAFALLGGAVPGIAHAVQLGWLPPVLEPEQYLGPPYAFSISGAAALTGAVFWSTLTCTGLVLRTHNIKTATAVLVAALALTALINLALPLYPPRLNWSILGTAQTAAITVAIVASHYSRTVRKHHAGRRSGPARHPTAPAAEVQS